MARERGVVHTRRISRKRSFFFLEPNIQIPTYRRQLNHSMLLSCSNPDPNYRWWWILPGYPGGEYAPALTKPSQQ